MTNIEIKHDARLTIARHYCVPTSQEKFVPGRRRAPQLLPAEAPMPRRGDVVYLSSSSAWVVTTVVHEWRTTKDLRVEIWLEHVGEGGRHLRQPGFTLTQ